MRAPTSPFEEGLIFFLCILKSEMMPTSYAERVWNSTKGQQAVARYFDYAVRRQLNDDEIKQSDAALDVDLRLGAAWHGEFSALIAGYPSAHEHDKLADRIFDRLLVHAAEAVAAQRRRNAYNSFVAQGTRGIAKTEQSLGRPLLEEKQRELMQPPVMNLPPWRINEASWWQ